MIARVNTDYLTGAANAIRRKNGTQNTYKAEDFEGAIDAISTATLITKTITENGTYNAQEDNADGYSEVEVDVQPLFTNKGVMYTKNIVFSENVTMIVGSLYANSDVETVVFPNSLKIIQGYAFVHCAYLQNITIPNSVTNILGNAFQNCLRMDYCDLTAFTDPNNIPTLGVNVFDGAGKHVSGGLKIKVLNQEMLDVFSNATNWSNWASKMVIQEA